MIIQNRYEYDPKSDLLGKGGFARVFRAKDIFLHRPVALKIFNATGQHGYTVLEEIRKVIQFDHPNILRYFDVLVMETETTFGEKEQTQIGVMELANAGDLKDFAKANPGSPLLYKLLKEVLLGLEYLHSQGIIHRDLKAQNILLVKGKDGQLTAKISDFGISKDTGSGGQSSSMMVGTIEYMAPEQFSPAKYGIDGKVSSNLDLWSFGIMVHELLTNTTPFGSRDGDTTAEQIMSQILSTEMPDGIDRLPEPYKSVVKKCLVANAKERIRKASELLNYFDGQTASMQQTTQTAQNLDNSTKIYPNAGNTSQTPNPLEQATKVYKEKPLQKAQEENKSTGKANKTMPKAAVAAAVVIALAGGGWWYTILQKKDAQVQAEEQEVRSAAEAKKAEEARVATENIEKSKKANVNAVFTAHAKRYQIIGNGDEVKDLKTGLIWQRCSLGQTWNGQFCLGQASKFSSNDAVKQGVSGWRVPDIYELSSLIYCTSGKTKDLDDPLRKNKQIANDCEGKFEQPAINQEVFPNVPNEWYWSSSSLWFDEMRHWYIYFTYGSVNVGRAESDGYKGVVRLVQTTASLSNEKKQAEYKAVKNTEVIDKNSDDYSGWSTYIKSAKCSILKNVSERDYANISGIANVDIPNSETLKFVTIGVDDIYNTMDGFTLIPPKRGGGCGNGQVVDEKRYSCKFSRLGNAQSYKAEIQFEGRIWLHPEKRISWSNWKPIVAIKLQVPAKRSKTVAHTELTCQ